MIAAITKKSRGVPILIHPPSTGKDNGSNVPAKPNTANKIQIIAGIDAAK